MPARPVPIAHTFTFAMANLPWVAAPTVLDTLLTPFGTAR